MLCYKTQDEVLRTAIGQPPSKATGLIMKKAKLPALRALSELSITETRAHEEDTPPSGDEQD